MTSVSYIRPMMNVSLSNPLAALKYRVTLVERPLMNTHQAFLWVLLGFDFHDRHADKLDMTL